MGSTDTSRERIEVLDAMRGLAALGVAWFHITIGFTKGSLLQVSGSRGWVGVEVFFVISGFIIPYSLANSSYSIKDYGRFVLKRIVRLDPPYLVSIAVSLAIAGWLSSRSGDAFPYSVPQILLHLGYLNVFSRYPWISQIYWTLAVEVQYYLLVGLAFPLILKRNLFWLGVAPLCVAAGFAWRNHGWIFQYLPLFLMGIAALHFRRGMLKQLPFILIVLALAFFERALVGRAPATIGLVSALAIAYITVAPRPLVALGSISYSLYLIHIPTLLIVSKILKPPTSEPAQFGFVIVLLVASLAAALLLYRTVELPSRRWSSGIRYRRA